MTTKKKIYRFIVPAILIIAFAAIYYHEQHEKNDRIFLKAEAIQSSFGWGYNIIADKKIYIHQEFIPAIPGKHGFKSKEDALLVGRKVIEKISSNQLPTITMEDLKELGITTDSLAAK